MKLLIPILIALTLQGSNKTRLVKFSYSSCLNEQGCSDSPTDIQSSKQVGNTLRIKLGAYENCIGNFLGGIDYRKDSILNFVIAPDTIPKRSKDGSPIILGEGAGCNCFYMFDYQIRGLSPTAIKSYLVNGRTFQENYNSALH
jgi:hypothetical protein